MNFGEETLEQLKPIRHFQRIFWAISTAACMFAFQNCSSIDITSKLSSPQGAGTKSSADVSLSVDQQTHTR